MNKIIVLGCGLVGRAIALDLSSDYDVTSCDYDESKLNEIKQYGINTIIADLSDYKSIAELTEPYDVVVGAVPGYMGYRVIEEVINGGKNVVDISFFPEDSLSLNSLAISKNVSAVVDCGVAPGMSNILLGYHSSRIKVENFICYVGGLPFIRKFPFQYKAPFSPIDVIEEYTRPARFIENSVIKTEPALSDSEFINFDKIGTLEAFNTDGLRTMLKTMKVPNMKEKTLRYPGHIEYIKVLLEAGFFSNKEILVGNNTIRPIEVTNKILFDEWKLDPDDEEFTVMKIIIEGEEDGENVRYTYNLFDKYDQTTKISSMARTTGYTASAVVHLMLQGKCRQIGIIPPEYIAANDENMNYIIEYLAERNVIYHLTKEIL
ncbi:MAG TPA: saccharopine dehydrogenase C-terminal domain-containing protein [Candidatus Kapabacteria bacterium]|nr:saccharopine dehydrogenase C-terminal domain-containing protein [Candidatus Kapabacteria bacterium]